MKFHISPNLGPTQCKAEVSECPYSDDIHGSFDDVNSIYQSRLENEYGVISSIIKDNMSENNILVEINELLYKSNGGQVNCLSAASRYNF